MANLFFTRHGTSPDRRSRSRTSRICAAPLHTIVQRTCGARGATGQAARVSLNAGFACSGSSAGKIRLMILSAFKGWIS